VNRTVTYAIVQTGLETTRTIPSLFQNLRYNLEVIYGRGRSANIDTKPILGSEERSPH
jgi:hypothetical protein